MSRQQTKSRIKGYQVVHAKNRALERYGVSLTPDDYKVMLIKISDGTAILIHKITNTRSLFKIGYKGQDYLVIYSKKTGRIQTFYSPDQVYAKFGLRVNV